MIYTAKLHFHSNEFLLREIVYSDSQYLCTCINQKIGDSTTKGIIFVHSLFHEEIFTREAMRICHSYGDTLGYKTPKLMV